MTLVVGDHVVRVWVDRGQAPRSMVVEVEVDGERSRSFEEPGWQDLALGVSGGLFYWWSARRVVAMPLGRVRGDPITVSADEDIRFAFAVSQGWVLVCESSVRLVRDDEVVSRLELGEVLVSARWENPRLVVRDADGHYVAIVVSAGRLSISPTPTTPQAT